MRQHISQFEALAGKTIEAATVVDLQVLLTFTDGTYAAISRCHSTTFWRLPDWRATIRL